ncbi:MAG: cystathionine beta-lyase [Pseudomonadota bacterium]
MSANTQRSKTKPSLKDKRLDTKLSHLGRDSHAFHGFVNPPLVRASTVLFESVEEMEAYSQGRPNSQRYSYGLNGTPTIDALNEAITHLEEAAGTVLVPSGLAAVTIPLLAEVTPSSTVFVPDNVYWPTRRFCNDTLARMGVDTVYYNPLIGRDIEEHLAKAEHAILFVEAPGSYTFEMPDLGAILDAAERHDAITMIDNTWATPLIYKPIAQGFDYSIQAGTKYYSGHSDLLIGAISASERVWPNLVRAHRNLGVQAGTEEIFLTLRGLRTLRVRLEQHEASALALARWLEGESFVSRVMHPGLPSDPGHALWQKHFNGRASGLFAMELNGSREAARIFLNTLELFGLGYSWGGYESLAVLAELGSARSVKPWDGGPLIRLQIGLEDVEDLKADILAGAHAAGLLTG